MENRNDVIVIRRKKDAEILENCIQVSNGLQPKYRNVILDITNSYNYSQSSYEYKIGSAGYVDHVVFRGALYCQLSTVRH